LVKSYLLDFWELPVIAMSELVRFGGYSGEKNLARSKKLRQQILSHPALSDSFGNLGGEKKAVVGDEFFAVG